MDEAFEWKGELTQEMKTCFDEQGYVVARNFLSKEELQQLWKVVEDPDGILNHSYVFTEPDGQKITRTLCMYPGSDVSGVLARSEKVVSSCEKLLGCEVYHWCSMFMLKEAKIGAKHLWHQDYGYWYNNGCLYHDMLTVWIPLVPCNKDNSCKQVLKGSHKLGRLNHTRSDDNGQQGIDEIRLEKIKTICDHGYLEMAPGDAFIHHGNLVHCSGRNVSDSPRMAFMCCYNGAHNSPYIDDGHPKYNKLDKVPNKEIVECSNYTDFSGKHFLKLGSNKLIRNTDNCSQ